MMKLLVFLTMFSMTIYAQEGNKKGAGQDEGPGKGKDHFLSTLKQQEETLSKRLTEVREAISCTEKAADDAAQKKCREEFRVKRQAFKKELREKMKDEKSHKAKEKKNESTN
jgi:hypothetical protein